MNLYDVYHRGKLYQGLNNYKDKIKKFTVEAKAVLADFTVKEAEKLLSKTSPDEDDINALELIADVCKYFIDDGLIDLLKRVMELKYNNVRYYALETLLANKCYVSAEAIKELANDLLYADLTYSLLNKYGKRDMFPEELANAEYLAKSDLVHWLTYPTELNKAPDEIELLGNITVKKQEYYIFKYKSDSDNLSEDLLNEWLIGWSNRDGGTFSNFDKLCDYQKKDLKKTLKYIAKKLLK